MKAYTDLKQSKALAKILPSESADMFYADLLVDGVHKYNLHPLESYGFKTFEDTKLKASDHLGFVPCWSLAALLNVLPYTIKLSHDTIDADGNLAYKNECYKFSINRCGLFGDKWNIQYYGKYQRQSGKRCKELYIDLFLTENYENQIDSCYEMIVKLHECKML